MSYLDLNLSEFKEYVDTEFEKTKKTTLPIKAFKTDAEKLSLKKKLNMQSSKSCDYISFKGNKVLSMIEFTDLSSQEVNLTSKINYLKNKVCCLDPSSQKKCVKKEILELERSLSIRNIILNELRQKCIETTLLVHKILDHKKIFYSERFDNKRFIVVVKEVNAANSVAMQGLRNDLKSGLNGIVNSVSVIPKDKLEPLFKKVANL